MSRHPEVKWAQRSDKVFITVLLADSKNAKVNLEPDGVFTFNGSAGAENHSYELKLELYEKVNVEESKINVGVRSIFCILEKAENGWWKKLLRGEGKPPHYVKVDWDKWVDEDDDNGVGNLDMDMGGMDFSKFGGMGGMEGMGDDGDFEDSDDEGEEVTKGGSANGEEKDEAIGGVHGDFEDSDDEGEEVTKGGPANGEEKDEADGGVHSDFEDSDDEGEEVTKGGPANGEEKDEADGVVHEEKKPVAPTA